MAIFTEYSWQQMVYRANALIGRAALVVGVDWGAQHVVTVTLQSGRNGLTLQDFSMSSARGRSGQQGVSDDEGVEGIPKKLSVHARTIGMSLSGASVLVKAITLPVMTANDLRDHLALELDRYISLDPLEVLWDVYSREEFSERMAGQQEHFLVVAKKKYVEQQIEIFRRNELAVDFVDVDIFALINLVTYSYGKKGTWLLAHIEPTGITMVLIRQGAPAYLRKEDYGEEWYGDLLDQVLQLELPIEAKKELGASAALLLEQFFEEVRCKISETLISVSDPPGVVLDKGILLSGVYAGAPGMPETLARSMEMPVHLVDPFKSITVPQATQQNPVFQQMAPFMNVAVGVALRGALRHD